MCWKSWPPGEWKYLQQPLSNAINSAHMFKEFAYSEGRKILWTNDTYEDVK